MQNKPKEIVEIEKVLDLIIYDYNFEKNILECINISNYKLTKDKISKVKKHFENLKRLFISKTEIEDLTFIDELVFLEELTITNCNLKIIPLKKANNNLKIIDLSCNQIENIEFLKNYKNVKLIDFSENEINDILVFKNFKNLTKLNLIKNKIIDISSLKGIKIKGDDIYEEGELLLGENAIFDLTPLYESLKSNKIQFMNAYDNPLVYPHKEIVIRGDNAIYDWFDLIIKNANYEIKRAKENNSKILDLGKLGLTDLSLIPNLFELVDLEELILSNEWAEYDESNSIWKRKESKNNNYKTLKNNISFIPKDFEKLKNLKRFIIGGDWKGKNDKDYRKWRIKDCNSVFKLENLEFLNISNNEINDITGLTKLTKISIAHLNNNNISEVPKLKDLSNLKEIYLSNNNIKDINFLDDCVQIETIDLHSNKIIDLTSLQELLNKSEINIKNSSWEKNCISVNKNDKNITPPYEIINQSKIDFINYIKSQEHEVRLNLEPYYNKEIKIVLVGNSYSGKSTFLNYLKTKKYKKNLPITPWLVTDLHDIILEKEKFKLRFFDFGGQDYYHDTHKLFFTSDCIYFLLWDSESNKLGKIKTDRGGVIEETQVFPLEYWLDSIKLYSKKSMSESELQMEQLLNERDRKINSIIRDPKKGDWTKVVHDNIIWIKNSFSSKKTLIIQNKIDVKKEYLNQSKLINDYNIYDFVDISLSNKIGLSQFKELNNQIIK